MRRTAVRFLLLAGTLAIGPAAARAGAEPAPLTVAYGTGVHAYHDGDFQRTYDDLSDVVEAGSTDPRVFYYRGLAALKLGRMDEAEADFQQGATLETSGRGAVSSHVVSRALERVQGCDRLKLEQYRSRARVAMLQRDRVETRRRYSGIEDGDADVLRPRRPERIEPAEAVTRPAPGAGDAEEPPAADGEARPAPARPAEKPADTANPFADEPAEK